MVHLFLLHFMLEQCVPSYTWRSASPKDIVPIAKRKGTCRLCLWVKLTLSGTVPSIPRMIQQTQHTCRKAQTIGPPGIVTSKGAFCQNQANHKPAVSRCFTTRFKNAVTRLNTSWEPGVRSTGQCKTRKGMEHQQWFDYTRWSTTSNTTTDLCLWSFHWRVLLTYQQHMDRMICVWRCCFCCSICLLRYLSLLRVYFISYQQQIYTSMPVVKAASCGVNPTNQFTKLSIATSSAHVVLTPCQSTFCMPSMQAPPLWDETHAQRQLLACDVYQQPAARWYNS